MRVPLVVQPQTSPLAQSFADISKMLLSAPTPEDRELKRVQGEYYAANTDKMRAEADQMAKQNTALSGAGNTLAGIFGDYTASGAPIVPWTNPDDNQFIQNPSGMPMESPEMAGTRRTTSLADLYAQVGKENAEAMTEGLAAAQAFGTPDDMRRSMVLRGKDINENFSPTGDEGNRIAGRNEGLQRTTELAKIAATPLSESQVKGGFLQDNFDSLDALSPYQLKALDALPSQGFSITTNPDGTTTVNMGGSGNLPTSAVNGAIETGDAADEGLRLIGELRKTMKPENFGLTGTVRSTAQGVAGQFGAMFNVLPQAEAVLKRDVNANPQAYAGVDLDALFDPSLPKQEVLANHLAILSARAKQPDGKLSNDDVRLERQALGLDGIGSMLNNQPSFEARLQVLEEGFNNAKARSAARLGQPNAAPAPTTAAPLQPLPGLTQQPQTRPPGVIGTFNPATGRIE